MYGLSTPTAIVKGPGSFEISGTDPDQAVSLFIFVVIFLSGVGLLVKGFI